MAAVVGDFMTDLSRFHSMVSSSSSSPQKQASSPRPSDTTPQRHHHQQPAPQHRAALQSLIATPPIADRAEYGAASYPFVNFSPHTSPAKDEALPPAPTSAGASQFPSPPSSSSPTVVAANPESSLADDAKAGSMAPQTQDALAQGQHASAALTSNPAAAAASSFPHAQQPSPPSEDASTQSAPPHSYSSSNVTSQLTAATTQPPQSEQPVIHIRDLAHIQMLVKEQILGDAAATTSAAQTKYEISQMPIGDVIEMVAALLTKITTTNDLQHDALQRNATHQQQANLSHDSSGSSHMSPLSHSVLAFHGKNVPAITILSYLSRIHKYCPTTYEVFLSLLVYFDRMTERVNDLVVKSEAARRRASRSQTSRSTSRSDMVMSDDEGNTDDVSHESDSDLADDDDDDMVDAASPRPGSGKVITVPDGGASVHGPATYFVVDSFNIHRLIIAGVTCASKFFSDVFYTNSRYAKVRLRLSL